MNELVVNMKAPQMYDFLLSLVNSYTDVPTSILLKDLENDFMIEVIWKESVPDSNGETSIVLYQITTYVRDNDRCSIIHKKGISTALIESIKTNIIEMY